MKRQIKDVFGLQLNENIFCCPKGFSKLTGKIAHVYTHNYTCAIFRVRSSPRPFSTLGTTSLTILFTLYIVSKKMLSKGKPSSNFENIATAATACPCHSDILIKSRNKFLGMLYGNILNNLSKM